MAYLHNMIDHVNDTPVEYNRKVTVTMTAETLTEIVTAHRAWSTMTGAGGRMADDGETGHMADITGLRQKAVGGRLAVSVTDTDDRGGVSGGTRTA